MQRAGGQHQHRRKEAFGAAYSSLHVTGSGVGDGLILGVEGISNFFAYDAGTSMSWTG